MILSGENNANKWAEFFAAVEQYNQDIYATGRQDITPITTKSLRAAQKRMWKPNKTERMREAA